MSYSTTITLFYGLSFLNEEELIKQFSSFCKWKNTPEEEVEGFARKLKLKFFAFGNCVSGDNIGYGVGTKSFSFEDYDGVMRIKDLDPGDTTDLYKFVENSN